MFCFQCQETGAGTGCTSGGTCGKSEETANYQDLLIYNLKGIGLIDGAGSEADPELEKEAGRFVYEALFATVTNTNFDTARFVALIRRATEIKERLRPLRAEAGEAALGEAAWPAGSLAGEDGLRAIREKAYQVGVLLATDPDLRSIRETVTYGLKGICAYAHHADRLGFYRSGITRFVLRALAALARETDLQRLFALALETGRCALETMALLDEANAAAYGIPGRVKISTGTRASPGILVSGHDLRDLEDLLVQAEGCGVDVYTNGEMIAAHHYPGLRKFEHLAGNYGNSWWRQETEFALFNGPILMTSNCITPVAEAYRERIYTTGVAGYPGVRHLDAVRTDGRKDFSEIIAAACRCPPPTPLEQGWLWGGFAHAQLGELAPRLLDLVACGRIRRVVVIGGCDGRDRLREYYRDLALALPKDTLILTAGCTKFMFCKLGLGEIDGVPRVLDAGQCNDCYSLIAFATRLKEAVGAASVNDLPLSVNVAWYDQKAVTVLLALLHLGVRNIRLGPTLPAFLSPRWVREMKERYALTEIGNAEADAAAMMRGE